MAGAAAAAGSKRGDAPSRPCAVRGGLHLADSAPGGHAPFRPTRNSESRSMPASASPVPCTSATLWPVIASADVTGPAEPVDPAVIASPDATAGPFTTSGPADGSARGQRCEHHPGLLISFEGGDGVGKTTQIDRLSTLLLKSRIVYRRTREPGGTELGGRIRDLLLHGGEVSPRAEALLYAADRAHHVATVVGPALARGEVVLTDRYLDSSVAYQGSARALGPQEVRDLSLWAADGLLPDLTILLDADPAVGSARTGARGRRDRLEREPDAFHTALRKEFRILARREPERVKLVDADRPVGQVAAEVTGQVEHLIAARGTGLRLESDGSGRGADPAAGAGAGRTPLEAFRAAAAAQ